MREGLNKHLRKEFVLKDIKINNVIVNVSVL